MYEHLLVAKAVPNLRKSDFSEDRGINNNAKSASELGNLLKVIKQDLQSRCNYKTGTCFIYLNLCQTRIPVKIRKLTAAFATLIIAQED